MHIYVNIIVDRDNLKKIIIGHNGSMIKEIGIRADICLILWAGFLINDWVRSPLDNYQIERRRF
jgi:GTPase Era involved in 16S rRNA processing